MNILEFKKRVEPQTTVQFHLINWKHFTRPHTLLISYDLSFQQKYKADFEKTKGKMIGLKGLQDDRSIAHSVHASKLQSDVSASS